MLKTLLLSLLIGLMPIFLNAQAIVTEEVDTSGKITRRLLEEHLVVTAAALPDGAVKLIVSNRFNDYVWLKEGAEVLDRQISFLADEIFRYKTELKEAKKMLAQLKKQKAEKSEQQAQALVVKGIEKQVTKLKADRKLLKIAKRPYGKALAAANRHKPQ
ncbi:MAG: hypothetical protein KBC12_01915 [Candidatus Pacebacteria bacterium]|nr:hypothetical protein [Candidatus Paceibacterota bacterium]MBP9851177.1 hypothetical protein [Candidatus Paceibacterota bacterium]